MRTLTMRFAILMSSFLLMPILAHAEEEASQSPSFFGGITTGGVSNVMPGIGGELGYRVNPLVSFSGILNRGYISTTTNNINKTDKDSTYIGFTQYMLQSQIFPFAHASYCQSLYLNVGLAKTAHEGGTKRSGPYNYSAGYWHNNTNLGLGIGNLWELPHNLYLGAEWFGLYRKMSGSNGERYSVDLNKANAEKSREAAFDFLVMNDREYESRIAMVRFGKRL